MDRGFAGAAKPTLSFAYDPIYTERVFATEQLQRLGQLCDVIHFDPVRRFDHEGLRERLANTEILVTGWGVPRIDAEALQLMPKLRLIAHAAGSVKYFIADEVFQRGVLVTSAVTANAVPVAEYTVATIIYANKRAITFRDLYARERKDLRTHPLMASDLGNYGKTVGIIGASRIGLKTIELLQHFDMEVLLTDPYATPEQAAALGVELVGLDELMSRSDVASLHAPSLPSTKHMIDSRRLALLRDGATFINTARGALVDQEALVRELVSGRIRAAIDVTEPEVLPADSPLYDLPNVLLTPHVAGSVGAERERLGTLVVNEVERFVRGERLKHAVEYATLDRMA
jgi:phosphoglycerate dehydrogenase-like enzyme